MLGKFAWEVLESMPPDELVTWVAYLKIKNDVIEKATKTSKPSRT